MRSILLWESQSPADADLKSITPFCHDTLQLHQWIQWVFLPRMKHVIESGNDMPNSSDIFPLAEYSFQKLEQNTQQLLQLIHQFDRFISKA